MKKPGYKKLFYLTGIWAVITLSLVQLWIFVGSNILEIILYRNNTVIQQAKEQQALYDINFYAWGKRAMFVALPMFTAGLAFIYVRAVARRKAVHTYKIGQSEIAVHEKDLNLAAPIGLGLMTAEQMRQVNGGVEQAFQLYTKMADVQSKQIQTLVRGAAALPASHPMLPAAPESPGMLPTITIPTFHDLLLTGEIAPGKPMILGYENGLPRRGSFLDIYSAAVAGESGSGKTATMLFLIGSALIAMPVKFLGIDPHYPHPKSLGAKTKPLWESGLMTMATFKDDMLKVLAEVERTIDRRLKTLESDAVPVVLVIDELAFLSKTPLGAMIAHTMERISTEGRKCQVYMLASSQTWLAARTGDSSVVRDTLTSAYVHRIKPKQANLLLQDRDEAEKVKKYVKQAGEALLCPVGSDSVVVRIPYTTEADLRRVVEQVGAVTISPTPSHKRVTTGSFTPQIVEPPPPVTDLDAEFEKLTTDVPPAFLPDTEAEPQEQPQITPDEPDAEEEQVALLPLADRMKLLLADGVTYGEIYKATGIAKSTMYNFVNGKGNLKSEQIEALLTYFERRERHAETPVQQA